MSSFEMAFEFVLGNEGQYVNNPADPGGATMWGITERVANLHGYHLPMSALPKATAMQIAHDAYWVPHNLDSLPAGIAVHVFDMVFNGGPAIQLLQKSLGIIPITGQLDPRTIETASSCNVIKIIALFNAYRLQYYTSLSEEWGSFGKGWTNRVANNLVKGLK